MNTRQLIPHDPRRLFKTRIPATYDPSAKNEVFLKFLREVLPDQKDQITIQQFFGYSLTLSHEHHYGFMLFGPSSRNGKTVLINTLTALVGEDNVSNEPLQTLESNRFAIARLWKKRLNSFAELKETMLIGSSTFKGLVGEDRMSAELKGIQKTIPLRNTAKQIYSCNKLPEYKGHGAGFWNKWVVITFKRHFEQHERDKGLTRKLTRPAALSGLLNWSLEGWNSLQKQGDFDLGNSKETIMEEWVLKYDPVRAFIKERLVMCLNNRVDNKDMYEAFSDYCDSTCRNRTPYKQFFKELKEKTPWDCTTTTEQRSIENYGGQSSLKTRQIGIIVGCGLLETPNIENTK